MRRVFFVVQSAFWVQYMMSPNRTGSWRANTTSGSVGCVCIMTAGTVFLMWLGEQIDEYGMGNGISLIIWRGSWRGCRGRSAACGRTRPRSDR